MDSNNQTFSVVCQETAHRSFKTTQSSVLKHKNNKPDDRVYNPVDLSVTRGRKIPKPAALDRFLNSEKDSLDKNDGRPVQVELQAFGYAKPQVIIDLASDSDEDEVEKNGSTNAKSKVQLVTDKTTLSNSASSTVQFKQGAGALNHSDIFGANCQSLGIIRGATCTVEEDQQNRYNVFNYPADSMYLITSDSLWDETQLVSLVAKRIGVDPSLIKTGEYVNLVGQINYAENCSKPTNEAGSCSCICTTALPTGLSSGKLHPAFDIKVNHVTSVKVTVPPITNSVALDMDAEKIRAGKKRAICNGNGESKRSLKISEPVNELPALVRDPWYIPYGRC